MSSPRKPNQNHKGSTVSMVFHATAFCLYGYALCWQNISKGIVGMAKLMHPGLRPYGRFKFLTYNCLILQFAGYSLCLAAHFVPRLRKTRDFVITTLALPVSAVVCLSFWGVWHVAGREYIFPQALEQYYPNWLNHITHTIILPFNIYELYLVKHEFSRASSALPVLLGYMGTYGLFLVYMRIQTGVFVYPFLNEMKAHEVGLFILLSGALATSFYYGGLFISRLFHGPSRTKSVGGVRQAKKSN